MVSLTMMTVAFGQDLHRLQTVFMLLQVAAAVFYLSVKRRELRVAATVLFGLARDATVRTIYA